jgi:hypothetical protein
MSFIQQEQHFRQLLADLDAQDTVIDAQRLASVDATASGWQDALGTVAIFLIVALYGAALVVGAIADGMKLMGACLGATIDSVLRRLKNGQQGGSSRA